MILKTSNHLTDAWPQVTDSLHPSRKACISNHQMIWYQFSKLYYGWLSTGYRLQQLSLETSPLFSLFLSSSLRNPPNSDNTLRYSIPKLCYWRPQVIDPLTNSSSRHNNNNNHIAVITWLLQRQHFKYVTSAKLTSLKPLQKIKCGKLQLEESTQLQNVSKPPFISCKRIWSTTIQHMSTSLHGFFSHFTNTCLHRYTTSSPI